jgi:GH25 family lysozyme M1 (1,4-beta-N-acetylmuramidase)
VLSLISGYRISYPVFIDVEAVGNNGRADNLDRATRTAVAKAFCRTIQNGGYTAGVYSNKSWFENRINARELTQWKIWLAQYNTAPSYTLTKYDLWQYSSQGSVSGISGNVDMNLSYLGY